MFGSDRESPALPIRNERAFGRGGCVRANKQEIIHSRTKLHCTSFRFVPRSIVLVREPCQGSR